MDEIVKRLRNMIADYRAIYDQLRSIATRSDHPTSHFAGELAGEVAGQISALEIEIERAAALIDQGLWREVQPPPPMRRVMGVDAAISGQDRSYITVLEVRETYNQEIAQEAFYITNGFVELRDRVRTMAQLHQPSLIVTDDFAVNQLTIEALQAEGLPVRSISLNMGSKRDLLECLIAELNQGKTRIPGFDPDQMQIGASTDDEIRNWVKISHPDAISLALALWGIRQRGVTITFA